MEDARGGLVLKQIDAAVAVDAPAAVAPGGPDVFLADDVAPDQPQALPTFGFPRDTLWPQIALSYVVLGLVLTILAAQLVAPTRRWRLRRGTPPAGGAWATAGALATSVGGPPPLTSSDPAATPAPDDPQTPDEVAS
jgi:hypothetical protein